MPTSAGAPCPRDSHGRELTTTSEAASCYRTAQEHFRDKPRLIVALRRAVRADPGFAVAAADLAALDGGALVPARPPQHAWERHHAEVVLAAHRGDVCRAADLLRDHLTAVACDPVAVAVLLDASQEPLHDILGKLPSCHALPAAGGPVRAGARLCP